ncbi:hypothetical protein [Streptomyces sp. SP18CS02]|uniref:hypothetical protein n=1 Tax=Streptomyces sp. SP18CS02 TaxID=3002531 RepID=UPI002E7A98E6|nr:hypothetical protein [Streptomyces sp. SP18CS02]MEE1751362.1 hypothetical protein [Streptomyces sp. SP18CS02]
MSGHRRIRVAVGAVFLAAAVAGCSGMGRTAVGTLTYLTADGHHTTLTSPPVTGCHKITAPGAVEVENDTLNDMVLYPTPDCSGKESIYVPTMSADDIAPDATPWLSYTFVH